MNEKETIFLCDVYLDWENCYLTYYEFCASYHITQDQAIILINLGKEAHNIDKQTRNITGQLILKELGKNVYINKFINKESQLIAKVRLNKEDFGKMSPLAQDGFVNVFAWTESDVLIVSYYYSVFFKKSKKMVKQSMMEPINRRFCLDSGLDLDLEETETERCGPSAFIR